MRLVLTAALVCAAYGMAYAETSDKWMQISRDGAPVLVMSVPEGWLVKDVDSRGVTVTFVPDAAHKWQIAPAAAADRTALFDGKFLNLHALSSAPPNPAQPPDMSIPIEKVIMIRPLTGGTPGSALTLDGGTSVNVRELATDIRAAFNPPARP